jgi:hypothetical protein
MFTMRKTLLNFLVFVISAVLLLASWALGNNGSRVGAAVGIVGLVAWMLFWNIWNRRRLAKPPQTDRVLETSEAAAISTSRKAIINFLRVLSTGLWLVGIVIGAGIFGRSSNLSYVFTACCVTGLGTLLISGLLSRKSQ